MAVFTDVRPAHGKLLNRPGPQPHNIGLLRKCLGLKKLTAAERDRRQRQLVRRLRQEQARLRADLDSVAEALARLERRPRRRKGAS